jgi:hypothetical protein
MRIFGFNPPGLFPDSSPFFQETCVMNFCNIAARVLAASLALFAASPAIAQANNPTGVWEIAVGGRFEGEKVSGIAYVEFLEDGSVDGYYLSRLSSAVYEVEGAWSQAGKNFTGAIDVFDGVEPYANFVMAGSARAGKSMSARLTDDFGSKITLKGKPFIGLAELGGGYSGTIRQYGQTSELSMLLTPLSDNGAYEIAGSLDVGGDINVISGYALANRKGEFVAYVYNETEGVYSSIWGKIRAGTSVKATGVSLEDGSKIQISLTSSGD